LAYTPEQVRLIVIKGRTQPPQIRYPTLIGAFSGARIGEVADATTHDVYQVNGMWVIDIRTDFRDEGQHIKTESSGIISQTAQEPPAEIQQRYLPNIQEGTM
jgi:hypothetical protein